MAEAAKHFAFGKREERLWSEEKEERQQLMESLAQTRCLISQAYSAFNSTGDPDLIESYVYEINALHSRYAYLLRRIKGISGADAPAAETALSVSQEKAESL